MTTMYVQPRFSKHIYTLAQPVTGKQKGTFKRGFMIWEKPIQGYKDRAVVHYLYNPSTVEATYGIGSGAGQAAAYAQMYSNASQSANIVVPSTQTASWSIMYDRTFELMGQAENTGSALNDPAVAGVNVDILSMMQFTGMLSNVGGKTASTKGATDIWPSVMTAAPAFAYFGGTGSNAIRYYGWIQEWDVTVTHFTQQMVPMRCVIDISWQMLPMLSDSSTPGASNENWTQGLGHKGVPGGGPPVITGTGNAGVSGR